ncbi:hypothetical protein ACLOJK_026756 [Asimina triloba]
MPDLRVGYLPDRPCMLMGVGACESSLGTLVSVGDDPRSGQWSMGQFLPPSSVPYESSPYFSSKKRGGSYLRRRFFEDKPIMPEDLDVIQEGYSVPINIVLSLWTLHETSQDYRPGHLCLNEHMLRVVVRVPFEFEVAEALLAFQVLPARVTPHS